MKLGKLFSVPLRIHPVAVPMMLTAMWLGEGRRLAIMSGSIILHELSHILAARMMHVQVIELELMPVGGAARMENLWRLRPGQMAAVALAGPLCNVLLMVSAAALCWWGLLNPLPAAVLIEQNAMIVCFNLLPALPMDGGRILCGLLECRMSAAGAARVGMWMSWVLAACLAALTAYGFMKGHLNLTLPAAALFLVMSAQQERKQAAASVVAGWTGRKSNLEQEKVVPIRWMAVGENTMVREVVMEMKPGFVHRVAVYDDDMQLLDVIEESVLLEQMMQDNHRMMRNLPRNVKSKMF